MLKYIISICLAMLVFGCEQPVAENSSNAPHVPQKIINNSLDEHEFIYKYAIRANGFRSDTLYPVHNPDCKKCEEKMKKNIRAIMKEK